MRSIGALEGFSLGIVFTDYVKVCLHPSAATMPVLFLKTPRVALAVALLAVLSPCAAQDGRHVNPTTDSPVTFDHGMGSLGIFSTLSNKLFKPDTGSAPYPAVVIGHTCGGVGNAHIRQRAKELLAAGFAVLTTDSYGPRGITQCRGQDKVNTRHQAIDAYAALLHLREVPEVNRNRIYYTGYSAGGMTAAMLAAPHYAPSGPEPLRFRALVSNYASCIYQHGPGTFRLQLLGRNADTPILMLMADRDMELRPTDCFPQLEEMKAAGKPVEWHVYKDTYHAWDQPGVNYTHVTGFGVGSVYFYSASVTADATKRMIDFFNKYP